MINEIVKDPEKLSIPCADVSENEFIGDITGDLIETAFDRSSS